MDNTSFEDKYRNRGIASQRRYPNEALIQFMAAHYLHLSREERARVRVLELGAGSCANLWMIAREGFAAYGIDIAPTGLDLGRDVLADWGVTASLEVMNMDDLKYDDEYFDAVLDVLSMQHCDLAGHDAAYQEVLRCLKPGGRFFQWHLGSRSVSFTRGGGNLVDRLTMDNIANPDVPLADNGQSCFLTPGDGREMLSRAGFTEIVVESTLRTYKNMSQEIEYLSLTAVKPRSAAEAGLAG